MYHRRLGVPATALGVVNAFDLRLARRVVEFANVSFNKDRKSEISTESQIKTTRSTKEET